MLSLLAKLGSGEMLGEYALAVAVITPLAMLSHLNLRAVLATDMEYRHAFGDYLAVRLATTAAVLAAMGVIALVSGYPATVAASMILVGVSLSVEIISDIYYAALQRRRADGRDRALHDGPRLSVAGRVWNSSVLHAPSGTRGRHTGSGPDRRAARL